MKHCDISRHYSTNTYIISHFINVVNTLEGEVGFEPTNTNFADLLLEPLGYTPIERGLLFNKPSTPHSPVSTIESVI